MKISYITQGNATDIHNWSGTVSNIARSLKEQGAEIHYMDNLRFSPSLSSILKKSIYRSLNRKFMMDRESSVLKNYAKEIISREDPSSDILFSPSSLPLTYIKSDKLKVMYADANFACMIDYYDDFCNLPQYARNQGNNMEKKSLDNCDLILYSSDWAAKYAIQYYGISPEKIEIVPFGANLIKEYSCNDIDRMINKKLEDGLCKLLFIGVDWIRKGGNLALKVAKTLNEKGIPTRLDIVGIDKKLLPPMPDYINVHGFISKETENGYKIIEDLFSQAHFFVLPTQKECYGIVFCESSAYGVPCLGTNTGGVSTIIKNGKNGKIFHVDARPEEYAEYITYYYNNKDSYKALSRSSFYEYQTRLNWNAAGKKIMDLISQRI